MSDYQITNYGIFSDAATSTTKVIEDTVNLKTSIGDAKKTLSDESKFMGPVADETKTLLDNADSKMDVSIKGFGTIKEFLPEASSTYKTGDKKAKNQIAGISTSTSGLTTSNGKTQASSFYELGDRAYEAYTSDDPAIQEWVGKVGKIVQNTDTHGIKKSLIIAQIINESGWMSSNCASLSDYNNVLGVNTDMGRITPDMQSSAWSQKRTSGANNVSQWNSAGEIYHHDEDMRHYDSVEECIEDYSEIVSLYHPELVGDNNIWDYSSFLGGYTPNPNSPVVNKYADMIEKYNLEQYDT